MPDFRTISDFRKRHLGVFKELFLETVKIAQNAGIVKLGHVSLDGSKVKANASKHKAMSYGRMKQDEQGLRQEISELVQQAHRTDRLEDAKYGNARGDELPEELTRWESRLAKIQESMAALEAEAKERAEAEEKKRKKQDSKKDDSDPTNDGKKKKRRGRPAKKEKPAPGFPEDKAQRNFTDPDSKIMRTKDGFDQAVRHAITRENLIFTMIGHTDPELHALGRQQAISVADDLQTTELTSIYTSPLRRSIETAQYISSFHPRVPLHVIDELKEIHLGIMEGQSSFHAYARYKNILDVALDP